MTMTIASPLLLPAVLLSLLAAAHVAAAEATPAPSAFTTAERKTRCLNSLPLVCNLIATEGFSTAGFVRFAPVFIKTRAGRYACRAKISARLSGLSPGRHGFHIHTYGDTRALDGTSTGGHFTNVRGDELPHGFASSTRRHMGDLNNVVADADGNASYMRVDNMVRLRAVLGRGITIHQDPDMGPDFQPTGSAGARVGRCVIGFANPDV